MASIIFLKIEFFSVSYMFFALYLNDLFKKIYDYKVYFRLIYNSTEVYIFLFKKLNASLKRKKNNIQNKINTFVYAFSFYKYKQK